MADDPLVMAEEEDAPITIKEVLTLPKLGIDPQFIDFYHVTMESENYICVREETSPRNSLLMIDVNNQMETKRRPITADSALMNPNTRLLALKAQLPGTTQDHLQIFNIDLKARIKSCSIPEQVVFWKWITPKMLGLVTRTSVYHWSIEDNCDSVPAKMFDRAARLSNNQIINYRCDPSKKWLVLIGIAPGAPERPHLVKGNMQLFSVDQQRSQALEAHAASFASFKVGGNESPSTLICFASRTANAGQITSRLYVTELVAWTARSGKPRFANKVADLSFLPDFADDFPLGIQISQKYSLIYVITKHGHLFVHDLETATAVYRNRISKAPIFLTTEASRIGGFFAVNKTGEVIQATVNEATIVPFVRGQLNNLELADNLAKKLAQVTYSDASQISNFRDEWSSLEVLYSDILDATDGFSESSKIGNGGYGSVYKGTLGSGIVAIKILDSKGKQGQKEFIQELEVLYQMWHPNLIKLVGACFEVHALVYEYLPNGSLEDCLRDSPNLLTWQMRTRIISEICSSLIYLHSRSVVHGDLKPANILLDANYKSKLSDFGLCRFLPQDMTTAVYLETVPKGTSGYIDPWFLENCILRPGSDLYSFGITILKLLTRMSPIGLGWKALGADENSFREMIDLTAGSWPFELAKELLYWSLQCCYHNEKSSELLEDMSTCLEDMLAEIETLQEGRSKVMARRKKAAEDPLKMEEKNDVPVVIMVLEINIHSVAYAQEIRERILRMKGVHTVKLVPKASEVSVKGAFDPLKLIDYVKRMTGKHVAIVRVERLAKKSQIEKEKDEKTDSEKAEKEVDELLEEVKELSLEEGFTGDAEEELSEEKGSSDKIL